MSHISIDLMVNIIAVLFDNFYFVHNIFFVFVKSLHLPDYQLSVAPVGMPLDEVLREFLIARQSVPVYHIRVLFEKSLRISLSSECWFLFHFLLKITN